MSRHNGHTRLFRLFVTHTTRSGKLAENALRARRVVPHACCRVPVRRLHRAQDLLERTEASVEQIAGPVRHGHGHHAAPALSAGRRRQPDRLPHRVPRLIPSYHPHQGFGPFLGNVVMGVIFGGLFVRWQRTNPMIIAHTLINAVAFIGYTLLAGHVSWLP